MNLSRVQEDRKEVGYALRAMARGKQKKASRRSRVLCNTHDGESAHLRKQRECRARRRTDAESVLNVPLVCVACVVRCLVESELRRRAWCLVLVGCRAKPKPNAPKSKLFTVCRGRRASSKSNSRRECWWSSFHPSALCKSTSLETPAPSLAPRNSSRTVTISSRR